MEYLICATLTIIILVQVCVIFMVWRINTHLEKKNSDLLDRLMAPDFYTYQKARESETKKMEVIKAEEFIERYAAENDGLRVD